MAPVFRLFKPSPVPDHHRRHTRIPADAWSTWSDDFLDRLSRESSRLRALPAPPSIVVRGCEPYDKSHTYRLSSLATSVAEFALDTSLALLNEVPNDGLRFFDGMLDIVSSAQLQKLFALLRMGVAALHGDARSALQPPVPRVLEDEGFLLHADLFLTNRVWLVFDDVPNDRSGKSLFLPGKSLDQALKRNALLPAPIRRVIQALLKGDSGSDAFDECFDLLHSEEHAWAGELGRDIRRSSWAVKLRRGEGYLLDDRRWLHGRTAASGGVRSGRFRRLVYC
jgi:hypothetical protein